MLVLFETLLGVLICHIWFVLLFGLRFVASICALLLFNLVCTFYWFWVLKKLKCIIGSALVWFDFFYALGFLAVPWTIDCLFGDFPLLANNFKFNISLLRLNSSLLVLHLCFSLCLAREICLFWLQALLCTGSFALLWVLFRLALFSGAWLGVPLIFSLVFHLVLWLDDARMNIPFTCIMNLIPTRL